MTYITKESALQAITDYQGGAVDKTVAREIIEQLAEAWTPTADHLPDPGRYLVTVKRYGKKGNKTSVSNYNEGTWSGYDAEDVLAWMPLPEPMEGNE